MKNLVEFITESNHKVKYEKVFKTKAGEEFMLLAPEEADNYDGLDKTNADCHVMNVGCIVVYPDTKEPFDNEYDLDEIYDMIEHNKCK